MKNIAECVCQAKSNRNSRKVISKTKLIIHTTSEGKFTLEREGGSLLQKKEISEISEISERTYTGSSGKLSFADLVNTFESKITSSKLPNFSKN